MLTEAVKSLYVGLDLHKCNVYCVILNALGQVVFQRRLPTQLAVILEALAPYKAQLADLAVESTFNWYWLVDGLQAAGYPVRLANPSQMPVYSAMKHTDDQSDARWLAELLRLGLLPEGYIYPAAERPVRDTLRRRMLVTQQATQTLLSVQSMVLRQTGRAVSTKRLEGWTRVEIGECFADEYSQLTAAGMLELVRSQRQLQRQLEKKALEFSRPQEWFQQLLTIPGIGPILGMVILLETGPIRRFASAGDYASYCRTVGSRRESAGKKKGENNRKNGNRYLAWAYVEAAHFLARFSPRAQGWFARKKARTMEVIAVKALACKLAKAAYYMLRDGVAFDEDKLFG